MEEKLIKEEDTSDIIASGENFKIFNNTIFPLSVGDRYVSASHLDEWADIYQMNTHTAFLSGRGHLKSTLNYSYMMWKLFTHPFESQSWMYRSFNESMAAYHVAKIKDHISHNPFFKEITDCKPTANSVIDYTWDGDNHFTITPAGVLTFKRGWHGNGVIADDILQDPANKLDLTVINKISTLFFEEVMPMPFIRGGELHLVGTPQDSRDVFFIIKDRIPSFYWGKYPAEKNHANQESLWPEMFPWEKLMDLRDNILGEKAYKKEYLCMPVRGEEAYFTIEDLNPVIDPKLKNYKPGEPLEFKEGERLITVGGMDIGKKRHPSHLALFQITKDGTMIQTSSKFMDGWDYIDQIDYARELFKEQNVQGVYYDDTRAEFESLREMGELPRVMYPLSLTGAKVRFGMAAEFGKRVKNGTIKLLNEQRMIDQILSVDNDLKAPETNEGHGDSFWGIALACEIGKRYVGETRVTTLQREDV